MVYVARNGELSEVLRIRVSPAMRKELVERAEKTDRSAGAVARAAIRSYLLKGQR